MPKLPNVSMMTDWIHAEQIVWLILSLAKAGILAASLMGFVAYGSLAERRILGFAQDRPGPNRVGIPFTNIRLGGLGQPIADGLKFLLKEELTPAHVNAFFFNLAPMLVLMPGLITIGAIPFGSVLDLRPIGTWLSGLFGWSSSIVEAFKLPAVGLNVDIGILFTFAIVSLSVYGIVLAGWASNSKYPFLGGVRSCAQMISYEIAMGLSVVPLVMIVGSLSFTDIISYQIQNGWLLLPFYPLKGHSLILWVPVLISFVIFLMATFAETNRAPFDYPESEQELIGGHHTEYGAMKFGFFMAGEYAAMVSACALLVTLFFGGWSLPLPWFNGEATADGTPMPWWFFAVQAATLVGKVALFVFFFIWIRWILPRPRYDQLMRLGWNVMIPVALANILLTAVLLALAM